LTITISAFVFMLLYNMRRPRSGRIWLLVIVGCLPLAVSWFGWDTITAEFNHGAAPFVGPAGGGVGPWADSLRIIQPFSLFGGGFGTYADIFPVVTSPLGNHIVDHTHNKLLEFWAGGGVIGFVLSSWFVFAVLSHGWRMIRARRDRYAVLLGIGALTGIIAMLTHSIIDFNMHSGADSLYFLFFCGLLVAIANTRFEYCESRILLKQQSAKQNIGMLAGTVVLTIFLLVVQYGALRARTEYEGIQDINANQHLDESRLREIVHDVIAAKWFDPIEYLYDFKLGTLELFLNNHDKSLDHFLQAARWKPMNGAALQRIGLLVQDEAKAMMLLENGYQRDLNNHQLAVTFVEFLLLKGEREKAVEVIAKSLQQGPALLERWVPLLDRAFGRDEIAVVLTHSVDAWIDYGIFLGKLNRPEEAEYYISSALSFLKNEEQKKAHWFQRIIQFYRENEQPEQAVSVLRQAVEAVPGHAPFHIQFGDYCRKEGITFLARQEYQRALMLGPGDNTAHERLLQVELND
jgi:tetratricopeptide (TPR) repeat protein